MSPARAHDIAARLGLATCLALLGLIVIGSVVRTTGSGLACPDWPLCEGRVIPRFEFHVMIEWSHRVVALGVSLLLFSTVAWVLAHRLLRPRLSGIALLAVALLVVQVLLGALTVWKLLHPTVVNTHLAVALLLFSTMITMTIMARRGSAAAEARPSRPARAAGLLSMISLATTLTFVQAVLGGTVSSNHAGLACPDWPACGGEWFPSLGTLAALQMTHRYVAYLLIAVLAATFAVARRSEDPVTRATTRGVLVLGFLQAGIGVMNVLLGTPVWVSAAHLGIAAAILGLLVALTCRVAAQPAREVRWAAVAS